MNSKFLHVFLKSLLPLCWRLSSGTKQSVLKVTSTEDHDNPEPLSCVATRGDEGRKVVTKPTNKVR